MMILIIDNYDSFTYNLYQLVGKYTDDVEVVRNNEITIDEIEKMNPSHIQQKVAILEFVEI